MELTTEAVIALAPDASSASAAKGLTAPAKWTSLGADDSAIWGACQGSGSKPYQTQVDRSGPAFKCSCPSRKFPCKHGLALLLLRASQPSLFSAGPPPQWVDEWLQSRQGKAERQQQKAVEKAAAPPPSAESVEKREAKRWKLIEEGTSQLQRWMADRVRTGIAALNGGQSRKDFDAMAARLVDAQAPGLGQRLRDAAQHIGSSDEWPAIVLRCFGQLQLAIDAVGRRAALSPATQADLRVALGWPLDKEDVAAHGEQVDDVWLVCGVAMEQREAKLKERRTWLQGRKSGRRALLLDFTHGAAGFDVAWVTGHEHDMRLAFFASGTPLRAIVQEQRSVTEAVEPFVASAADEWTEMAKRRAGNPWLSLAPICFDEATPVEQDGRWSLHTNQGVLRARLSNEAGWMMSSFGGGHAMQVFGEWDGTALTPLTASRTGSSGDVWLFGAGE